MMLTEAQAQRLNYYDWLLTEIDVALAMIRAQKAKDSGAFWT